MMKISLIIVCSGLASALRLTATKSDKPKKQCDNFFGRGISLNDTQLTVEIYEPSQEAYHIKGLFNPETYYGQLQQDKRLKPILPEKGFFVESGAFNGEDHSNTLHFERKGWEGLLVEALPWNCDQIFSRNRKAHTFCGALSTTGKVESLTFVQRGAETGGLQFSRNIFKTNKQNIPVVAAPVEHLLSCIGRSTVDFWSLDVEGAEVSILQKTPFKDIEFGVVLIEVVSRGRKDSKRVNEIHQIMSSNGFEKCGSTAYDDIWVNPSYYEKRGLTTPSNC